MVLDYQNLLFEKKGNVADVVFNRPHAANTINLDLAREFSDAIRICAEDPTIRAVVLRGEGKLFCAGGDLKDFGTQPSAQLPGYLERVTHFLHRAITTFAHMSSPIVAAVHGSAAGAGFSLVCACDFVIAAKSAKFTMAYTNAALTPDGSSTYFLPRIVGYKRALELSTLNPVLSADEAFALGLVTRVVPDSDVVSAATAMATQLAAGPTGAYGGVKRLLLASANNSLETQMSREAEWLSSMSKTRDAREGIAAFLAKRTPKFSGD
ncbi:MAG TPA: enoyl-CoA hydratase-related protein [Candidatus Binataceae bacterium]|nr:enoyl-CoA hydratase-related protein [Candidatus Binataceae bacterium]